MSGIPDYKSFMLPLLDILGDEQPHTLDSLNERLAIVFKFSQEEKDERVKCGRQFTYKNRIVTARTFLMKAGYIEAAASNHIVITESGKQFLAESRGE